MNSSPGKARFIIGGILVALGVLLLLSNTNVINLDWGWDFVRTWWPILLIVWGLWELVSGGFRFRLWPIFLLLLGIGFQLSALNLWPWDFSVVWPAFIVIVGLAILLGRRSRRARRRDIVSGNIVEGIRPRRIPRSGSNDSWRAVFNSIEETFAGQEFRGGEVEANFGNVVLDLREATLPDAGASLEVNLTFGGLHLRVPATWQVNLEGLNTHFGHGQDNRAQAAPKVAGKVLTVTGTITFGNVEVSG